MFQQQAHINDFIILMKSSYIPTCFFGLRPPPSLGKIQLHKPKHRYYKLFILSRTRIHFASPSTWNMTSTDAHHPWSSPEHWTSKMLKLALAQYFALWQSYNYTGIVLYCSSLNYGGGQHRNMNVIWFYKNFKIVMSSRNNF